VRLRCDSCRSRPGDRAGGTCAPRTLSLRERSPHRRARMSERGSPRRTDDPALIVSSPTGQTSPVRHHPPPSRSIHAPLLCRTGWPPPLVPDFVTVRNDLGSHPLDCYGHPRCARVAEWQTRWIQVPVPARAWGFNSPLAHHGAPTQVGGPSDEINSAETVLRSSPSFRVTGDLAPRRRHFRAGCSPGRVTAARRTQNSARSVIRHRGFPARFSDTEIKGQVRLA
jgi:hypothetical protein